MINDCPKPFSHIIYFICQKPNHLARDCKPRKGFTSLGLVVQKLLSNEHRPRATKKVFVISVVETSKSNNLVQGM